jgi:hypothetical protein
MIFLPLRKRRRKKAVVIDHREAGFVMPATHCDTSLSVIDRAERCGIFCSCVCALHCTLVPLLISSLPVLLTTTRATSWLQLVTAVLSAFFACKSIAPAYRIHRCRSVVFLAGAGTGLQLAAACLLSHSGCSVPNAIHSEMCPCRTVCGLSPEQCIFLPFDATEPQHFPGQSLVPSVGAVLLLAAHGMNRCLRN